MPRVLIVDDEESIRNMLQLVLQKEGFIVTTVGSVMDALALISHLHFDVLISDLNIGHPADGFVVVSAMRRTQPDALTFILTGYPAFETALEALRKTRTYIKPYASAFCPSVSCRKLSARSMNNEPKRRLQELRDELRRLMDEQVESLKAQTFGGISEEELRKEDDRLNRIREVSADFLLALKNLP
jgi:DNA-binding NtrC family response regulator